MTIEQTPLPLQRNRPAGIPPLLYGCGVNGKFRFRVRHRHIAEHLAPLIRGRAAGAAKLDLLLRGIALLPEHAGRRQVGIVLPHYSYEDLHDLVRHGDRYGGAGSQPDYSAEVRRAKRKWVGEQIEKLETLKLIHREKVGGRPRLVVLSDDGAGNPLDDPTGKGGELYVTVHGTLFSTGTIRDWGAPELSFYLAAMIGEGFDRGRAKQGTDRPPGGGVWFRTLDWFADPQNRRPESHIRVPFSVPTLERGLHALRSQNFVATTTIRQDPVTKRRFERPRNLYRNLFDTLEWKDVAKQPEIRRFLVAINGDSDLLLGGLPVEIGGGVPTVPSTEAEETVSSASPATPA